MPRYEVDFPTEDSDVEAWIESIALFVSAPLTAFVPASKLEEIIKEFCLSGINFQRNE
jgi:hypothetical protein